MRRTDVRVALVSHYYAPHKGGVETLVAEQARGLIDRGCTVEVLTSRLKGDARVEEIDGVTVRRFTSVNLLSRINIPVPLVSPRMIGRIRNGGYDAVVAHGHCYVSSVYVALASRVPFVLWQSNPFVEYGRLLNAVERIVDQTIGRYVAWRADRVVAISEHTARYVSTFRKGNVTVIHPGVDTNVFKPQPRDSRASTGRPVVRTLRRLVPRQGVDTLVQAWMKENLGSEAVLEIGGAGPQRDALASLAAGDPSITFRGRIPDDELVDFYAGCDLFVLPTAYGEGYGLVAAEAMSCGRPVVATTSGGPSEIVRDGVDGLLVPAGDVAELGNALAALVRDPARRSVMASAAAERNLSGESGHDATWVLLRALVEQEHVTDGC